MPVLAALGRSMAARARPITNLTLFGGFASTVCWPAQRFHDRTCRLAHGLLRLRRPAFVRIIAAANGGGAGARRRELRLTMRRTTRIHARRRRGSKTNADFALLAIVLSVLLASVRLSS